MSTDTAEAPVDMIVVDLTERQARALANLIETGRRASFLGVIDRGPPADLLTDPEMADLELRLRRALGEKP